MCIQYVCVSVSVWHSMQIHWVLHSVCLCFNVTQYANTLSVAFSMFVFRCDTVCKYTECCIQYVFRCDTVCKYTECCIQYVCVSMWHSMQIHWVLHSVCLCFNVTECKYIECCIQYVCVSVWHSMKIRHLAPCTYMTIKTMQCTCRDSTIHSTIYVYRQNNLSIMLMYR